MTLVTHKAHMLHVCTIILQYVYILWRRTGEVMIHNGAHI